MKRYFIIAGWISRYTRFLWHFIVVILVSCIIAYMVSVFVLLSCNFQASMQLKAANCTYQDFTAWWSYRSSIAVPSFSPLIWMIEGQVKAIGLMSRDGLEIGLHVELSKTQNITWIFCYLACSSASNHCAIVFANAEVETVQRLFLLLIVCNN